MIGQYGIPAAYGGVERVVEELGAELVRLNCDVTVYCSKTSEASPASYRGMDLRTVKEIKGKYLGKLSQAGFATLDALFRPYDIVHFHAMGPCLFAPLVRLFRPDIKVCSTIHSRDDLFRKWTGPARWLFRLAAWCAAKVPHQVMVVSEELRRQLRSDFDVDATVVRNGVSIVRDHGDDAEIARWGLEPNRYLLTVGRLVHEKATDHLVAAFGRTKCNWQLVIVGEHAHTGDFADLVHRLAIDDNRVVLTGPVFGAPLDALYRNAGAFVLPSRLEGMPVVLLEAIGYGLPVIVSDIPPNIEVVKSCSPGQRIVRVGDIDALAASISDVIGNWEAERVGAQTLRKRVIGEFSWPHAAAITRAEYLSLLPMATNTDN
jgi:glycosyltransferase involved in cell wall biosynthesis